MAITDISISEELMTNAPSIKYSGNEGPKSPEQEQQMMVDALLKDEYDKYVYDLLEQRPDATPMSFEEFRMMVLAEGQMSKGPILPSDEDPINPFQPKPTGPVLPDRMMAGTDTPEIEIEILEDLLRLFREKFNRDPVSIDELKRAIGQMREKAAYGGIMGIDGRRQYGIGSFFQKYIKDPIEVAITGKTFEDLEKESQERVDREDALYGKGYEGVIDRLFKGEKKKDDKGREYREGGLEEYIIPAIGGITAGLFTKKNQDGSPSGGQLTADETALMLADLKKSANILDQEQGLAAGLNFLPAVSARKFTPAEMIETYKTTAANGGRIGFENAGPVVDEQTTKMILDMHKRGMDLDTISTITQQNSNTVDAIIKAKLGPGLTPAGMAEGGIMDLGGMEKDYRNTGGFVDIGAKEKADDVPARLSVNEFVFTADAVRNAGGGDIDRGAQVMENMMKNLEAGGQVSRESQGMAGARDMFEVSERLSEVI